MAIVTICGCAMLVLNFAFCAGMCQYRVQEAKKPLEWMIHFLNGDEDTDAEVKDQS